MTGGRKCSRADRHPSFQFQAGALPLSSCDCITIHLDCLFLISDKMFNPSPYQGDQDAGVRSTDFDASIARFCAVQRGYLTDPYVRYFVPRAHLHEQRSPVINIGTFLRSESIDRLIDSWFDSCRAEGKKCQIVSLGSGSDTRFWRMKVRMVAFWHLIRPVHATGSNRNMKEARLS